jgi:isocitrate lyase
MEMSTVSEQAAVLRHEWATNPRWAGVRRDYTAEDVIRLRGSFTEEHPLARRGAERLWNLLQSEHAVRALGTIPGHQAGFSGVLNAFELMKSIIDAGAAGVHLDDQLSPDKRGHLGGKILIPTSQQVRALSAARLAADVLDVPSLIVARTHAQEASLLTSAVDEWDQEFLTGERTEEGFYRVQPGLYARVRRGLAFAPYADLLWLETATPNLAEARAFAAIIHSQYPDQLLAYSCAASFNWRAHLDDASIATFQTELAALGYRFQPVTLAGAHETGTGYLRLVTQVIAPDAETMAFAAPAGREQFAAAVG